jgi:hypothetical protein
MLHDVKQRSITPPNQKEPPGRTGRLSRSGGGGLCPVGDPVQHLAPAPPRVARSQAHRRAPAGSLSARSVLLSLAVVPSLPQWLQRIRGPNEGTGTSFRPKRRDQQHDHNGDSHTGDDVFKLHIPSPSATCRIGLGPRTGSASSVGLACSCRIPGNAVRNAGE